MMLLIAMLENSISIIDQINYTPLLHVGDDYLLSTAQSREFVVATHDVANRHAGKQYIHYWNRFITTKFYNSLMYVTIR